MIVHLIKQQTANVKLIKVENAEQMKQAVFEYYREADIVIKSAAVADYRPVLQHMEKMKKKEGSMTMEFERTVDILKSLGEEKEHQILVGFAAETEQLDFYAMKKLKAKNADIIVANNVKQEGAGFGGDTNVVTFFHRDGSKNELPLLSKDEVAEYLLKEILALNKNKDEGMESR